MAIAMVSILEGRGEDKVIPFLKKHYGFEEGGKDINLKKVDYEVVGGYLAHIKMPDKSTRSGEPYVCGKPGTNVFRYSNPLHKEDINFYTGEVEYRRKTLHFIGEEEKLSELLKQLTVDLREHFWPEDFNRDLGAAVRHWFPDFEIK
ncbi:hypothetical protein KY342_00355 [Candidatus Woesearchaeota archaeon]|nr:hypothetical protein [Candidatus Woesearchaeota archaeon]